MDRYVKNFIAMSIIYLAAAAVLGVFMLVDSQQMVIMKFVHSHLMLLGWVSMMIYGVGYHILPKFAGKFLKWPKMAEAQFWIANIGLIGMVVFYAPYHMGDGNPSYKAILAISGVLEVLSIVMFFANMMVTLYEKPPQTN